MTFNEFIAKYDGKGINYDGAYGNQCVDLYRQYVKEVCGVPQSPSVAGAKDIWNTYLSAHFDRIANTPTGVPQAGDIVIWGSTIGTYGHVAVFISGNVNTFTSFDQNWPDTGGKGVAHKQSHDYKGVLGWLRLKKAAPPPPPPPPAETELQKAIRERGEFYNEVLAKGAEIEQLKKTIDQRTNELTDALNFNKDLTDQKALISNQLTEALANIETQKATITDLEERLKKALETPPPPPPAPIPTPQPKPETWVDRLIKILLSKR